MLRFARVIFLSVLFVSFFGYIVYFSLCLLSMIQIFTLCRTKKSEKQQQYEKQRTVTMCLVRDLISNWSRMARNLDNTTHCELLRSVKLNKKGVFTLKTMGKRVKERGSEKITERRMERHWIWTWTWTQKESWSRNNKPNNTNTLIDHTECSP